MAVLVNENDPRVKRTRELLLRSFCELAQEKNMHAISVQDITERATVNRATFYAHFRDKEDVMDAAFRRLIRQALTAKLAPTKPLTAENLRLLYTTMCEFIDTIVRRCPRTGECHPLVKTTVQEELYEFLVEWLRQSSRNGTRRYSAEALATLLSWSLFGAAVEWNSRRESSREVAGQVVDLLIEAVGAEIM